MGKISLEIKNKAKILGIVYHDKVYSVFIPAVMTRLFCKTLNKLELRDHGENDSWNVPEEEIFHNAEVVNYAYIVKKSRRKPRKERRIS